jgi:hypothetical protein
MCGCCLHSCCCCCSPSSLADGKCVPANCVITARLALPTARHSRAVHAR